LAIPSLKKSEGEAIVRPSTVWPFPPLELAKSDNIPSDSASNTKSRSADDIKHEALITGSNGTNYRVLLRTGGKCEVFVSPTDEQVEAKSTLMKYIVDHKLEIDCEMPINTRVLGKRFFAWYLKKTQSK